MKTFKISVWLLLVSTFCFGQNLVRDRLNSKRVNTRVVINFTGDFKTPRYSIDEKEYRVEDYGWNHEFNTRTTFAIDDETANLQLKFLNPLRYKVEISTKEKDDPIAQAIDKFIDNSAIVGRAIGSDSLVKGFFPFEKDKVKAKISLDSANQVLTRNPETVAVLKEKVADTELKMKTSMLFEWYLFAYSYTKNGARDTSPYACIDKNSRDKIFKDVCKLDELLYSKRFEDTIRRDFNKLKDKDRIVDFIKMINETRNDINKFNKEINDDISKFEKIETFSYIKNTQGAGANSYLDLSQSCKYYEQYSNEKIDAYKKYAEGILKKRLAILDNLSKLCDELETYLMDCDEKRNTVLVESLKTKNGKINEVTIIVQKIEWEEDNKIINTNFAIKSTKEISKVTFNVVPFASVVTEFGIGVVYFFDPMDFPKYGLVPNPNGTNTSIVAQTSNDQVRYLPLPTLTIVPRWGKGDIFWQFQIGASIANSLPVLHAGGGLRLFSINNSTVSSVSIMGGVALKFTRELNTYQVGSVATADQLDKDLTARLNSPVYPYIGFQFNF